MHSVIQCVDNYLDTACLIYHLTSLVQLMMIYLYLPQNLLMIPALPKLLSLPQMTLFPLNQLTLIVLILHELLYFH